MELRLVLEECAVLQCHNAVQEILANNAMKQTEVAIRLQAQRVMMDNSVTGETRVMGQAAAQSIVETHVQTERALNAMKIRIIAIHLQELLAQTASSVTELKRAMEQAYA